MYSFFISHLWLWIRYWLYRFKYLFLLYNKYFILKNLNKVKVNRLMCYTTFRLQLLATEESFSGTFTVRVSNNTRRWGLLFRWCGKTYWKSPLEDIKCSTLVIPLCSSFTEQTLQSRWYFTSQRIRCCICKQNDP